MTKLLTYIKGHKKIGGNKKKGMENERKKIKTKKKWQAIYIAPLQPHTFAVFPLWRILQELVV